MIIYFFVFQSRHRSRRDNRIGFAGAPVTKWFEPKPRLPISTPAACHETIYPYNKGLRIRPFLGPLSGYAYRARHQYYTSFREDNIFSSHVLDFLLRAGTTPSSQARANQYYYNYYDNFRDKSGFLGTDGRRRLQTVGLTKSTPPPPPQTTRLQSYDDDDDDGAY